jgi:integrase
MSLFQHRETAHCLLSNLPPLPAVVKYYDDFSDSYDRITNLESGFWRVHFDGTTRTFSFEDINSSLRDAVMCWCAFILARLSPVTAFEYLDVLKRIPSDLIVSVTTCDPQDLRSEWKKLLAREIPYTAFAPTSSFLAYLCNFSVGKWDSTWLDLISQMPYPKRDKYASVRVGDVFLSFDEEAAIIQHIDDVSARILARGESVPDDLLEGTAILLCSYQFAFRAKQIAMLEMRNVHIWNDGLEGNPAVHLTFTMIKQRNSRRVFPMIRRVKREWSPLFVELFDRAMLRGLRGADHVFQRTPTQVSQTLADLTESLLQRRRTLTELRHTAAQRLVDAGASEEELAAFMGHTDLDTGLVYFNSSRSQAERINQALGISSTYQNVMKIAHSQFISAEELAGLKGEQQIAGVPHGIPIAGIGGCEIGQPSCPNNPVMSCYGCSRFMPIASARIHMQVLEDLREVMRFFYVSSYAERGSPALQLEGTIAKVQAVIDELGGQRNELES